MKKSFLPVFFVLLGFAAAWVLSERPQITVDLEPFEAESEEAGLTLPEPEIVENVPVAVPGERHSFAMPAHVYQTFNNCGPATLSMLTAHYGVSKSQAELGQLMRPYQNPRGDNDDKSIFSQEFVDWAEHFGFAGLTRPAGDLTLLKAFAANDVPVVVRTWLRVGEDIGHYRIVRGYDDTRQVIIQDDSYFGPGREIGYGDFLAMWQPFNYEYFVIYPPEQDLQVKAILGENVSENLAWQKAEALAREESLANPANLYPRFNLAVALYHLGRYAEAVSEFEAIESMIPSRMLWYQLEPILAYVALGRDAEVFAMTDRILQRGNRAFSELYQIRGEIYLRRGELASARREFELAVFYNKNFEPAILALAALEESL